MTRATVKTYCRFCHAYCPMQATVEDNRLVALEPDPSNEVYGGYSCVKGRQLIEQLDHPTRLRQSQKKQADGSFAAIGTEQALDEIAKTQPDLVLLDAMMPKRDGFDVCQTIRANPRWTGVRVIMLTAKGRDIEREKGLAMGADDYITKPFSTKEVVARVETMLGPVQGRGDG